jgi:hypothetical protein
MRTKLENFFKYCLKHRVTHIPSALSSLFFIERIIQLLSKHDYVIIDGRSYCSYIFDYFGVSEKVVFRDAALFNALPLGVGYALSNRNKYVWINLSDSQVTHGSFYQSLVLIKKFKLDNVLITIDFNQLRLRGNVDISYESLQRITTEFIRTFVIFRPDDIKAIKFPSCLILKTKKGFGCTLLEQNPMEYHYRRMDENFYLQCIKHISL